MLTTTIIVGKVDGKVVAHITLTARTARHISDQSARAHPGFDAHIFVAIAQITTQSAVNLYFYVEKSAINPYFHVKKQVVV